jgi:hypothetical protein
MQSSICERTCEGGPEGFAIGNRPCRGIEWDDIAFGMILSDLGLCIMWKYGR